MHCERLESEVLVYITLGCHRLPRVRVSTHTMGMRFREAGFLGLSRVLE